MAQRPIGSAVLLTILCVALASGCCPSGPKVLESLALPVEVQAGCSLVPAKQVTDGPLAPMASNPLSTSDSRKVSAIVPLVTGAGTEDAAVGSVKSAYAAVYECEPGGPLVRVYAVLFREPTGSARAAMLEANPGGVMFKGQLAGVVLADEDACESCYDAVMTRAEMVLGK
ncbi:MAG: hypothetical protein ABIE42_10535 [Candidatus Eisenbacteria bacterium]